MKRKSPAEMFFHFSLYHYYMLRFMQSISTHFYTVFVPLTELPLSLAIHMEKKKNLHIDILHELQCCSYTFHFSFLLFFVGK